jgi:Swt1-like HEPN
VSELIEIRNRGAHQGSFSTDDAYRALDTVQRMLASVAAADQALEADRMRQELLRVRFSEQARQTQRRAAVVPIEGQPAGGLRPWRELITPHPDVASGRYQQAEFAADLHQVWRDEAAPEYGDPAEFFRRTFLTDGLRELLLNAVRRWRREGGDPVVELQTNFGGGKTHSMIAPVSSGGRLPAQRAVRRRGHAGRPGRGGPAAGRDGRAGWADDPAGPGHHQAGRHRGQHPLGRAGLAARSGRGVPDGRRRRPIPYQSRRRLGRPAPPPCPLPGPH